MAKTTKVPVSLRALMQRVNRRLAARDEQLKAARGEKARQKLGDFYSINTKVNALVAQHVDPEKLARELGVLQPWETLAE